MRDKIKDIVRNKYILIINFVLIIFLIILLLRKDENQYITEFNGVDYELVYDYRFYRAHNPNVIGLCGSDEMKTLQHFVEVDAKKGCYAKEDFNVYFYRKNYPELEEIYGDEWELYFLHYISIGFKAGLVADRLR